MPETPVNSGRSTTRRGFLKHMGGALGAVSTPCLVPGSVFGADAPSNRVHVALIGCGNQSRGDLPGVMRYDDVQVTAVCDVNKGSYGYASGVELICRTQKPGFGVRFEGTEGWVQYAEGKVTTHPESLADSEIGSNEIHLPISTNHYRNLLDCVKSREEPIEPVEVGHRTACICHAGNIAMQLKRKVRWDPHEERFIDDDEANRMLRRPYREPWVLAGDRPFSRNSRLTCSTEGDRTEP